MTFETTTTTIARVVGLFLPVFLLGLPSTGAADQAKEQQMIPPQTEIQKDVPRHEGQQPGESTTGELATKTQKPMMAPEGEGSLSMEQFITPDLSDFESARESDSLSAVSF